MKYTLIRNINNYINILFGLADAGIIGEILKILFIWHTATSSKMEIPVLTKFLSTLHGKVIFLTFIVWSRTKDFMFSFLVSLVIAFLLQSLV